METEAPIYDADKKIATGEYDEIAEMVKPPHPGHQKGSPEWTAYMVARRTGLRDKVDYERYRAGRATVRRTRKDVEAAVLDSLVPKALKVLKAQLESPDERVAQAAAVKVLEYTKGKPVQQVKAEVAGVSTIIYQSAAFLPELAPVSNVLELTAEEDDDDAEEGVSETGA